MKSSLPPATPEQSYRIEIIKREIGCIACYIDGYPETPADAHHLIDPATGNRISHDHTIPLCPFMHHKKGPVSIHQGKIEFRRRYGTDEELLEKTNQLYLEIKDNTIGGRH